jgi:hypothetical protein
MPAITNFKIINAAYEHYLKTGCTMKALSIKFNLKEEMVSKWITRKLKVNVKNNY